MSQEAPEPLLSAEETSALLDAMRSGAHEGAASVESADLGSAERPLRDALGAADSCARGFAKGASRVLLRATGYPSASEDLPSEITPYKVLRASLPDGAAVIKLMSRDGSVGLLVIGPLLVSFILDRRMGAPVSPDGALDPRADLSSLDRRLLLPVAQELAQRFAQLWCDEDGFLQPGEMIAHIADFPPLAQFEPLLQIALRIAPAGLAGDQITVALPSGIVALARALRRPKDAARAGRSDDRGRMAAALRAADVEAVAILGEAHCTVRQLLAMQVNDVVRLEGAASSLIPVLAGDRVVVRGAPVVRHGNLAIAVHEVGDSQP